MVKILYYDILNTKIETGDKMNTLNDFYNSILNIKVHNSNAIKETIEHITLQTTNEVKKLSPNLEGFCKFLASQIQEKLTASSIRNYWLDLHDLINVDHVVLIAEYRTEEGMKRLLIDPSFTQFTKQENKKLLKFTEWPSEKIGDKTIVDDLTTTGVTEIDNNRWQDYISSFPNDSVEINLNQILETKVERKIQ